MFIWRCCTDVFVWLFSFAFFMWKRGSGEDGEGFSPGKGVSGGGGEEVGGVPLKVWKVTFAEDYERRGSNTA